MDFVIGSDTAVEVKGTATVTGKHLKALHALSEENVLKHRLVVSLDERARKTGDILILPWREFLARLWAGEL